MIDKLRVKITIFATLIITAYCFFNQINFLKTCYSIISTIIIFYFIGSIAEYSIRKQKEQILKEKQKKIEEEKLESEQNQDLEEDLDENSDENLEDLDENLTESFNYDTFEEEQVEDGFYDDELFKE